MTATIHNFPAKRIPTLRLIDSIEQETPAMRRLLAMGPAARKAQDEMNAENALFAALHGDG